MEVKILEAAWILPGTGPPIENGSIVIAGNRIEKVGKKEECGWKRAEERLEFHPTPTDANVVRHDFGRAIIVPGFINLHTHLEYTGLQSLPVQEGLFAWLPRLIEATAQWPDKDRLHSAQQGIREVIAAGTTFVVDNSYNGASAMAIARAGLRGLIGLEIFGVDQSLSDVQWQRWQKRHEDLHTDQDVVEATRQGRLAVTVAPHAPYTVCPSLWRLAQQWAQANNQIILTHLAESEAECRWFGAGDMELTQFLINAFARQDPDFARTYQEKIVWKKGNSTPVEHLYEYGLLANNLLAGHAVHISAQDMALLSAKNVAIAHCPRSNAKLGCGRAPLGKMLNSGLRVGLGTDSRASNDDLDLLAEARFAVNLHKSTLKIDPRQIIEYLTVKAAACLQREHELGTLTPGKLADIAVFALPQGKDDFASEDPYYLLLHGGLKLQALFVDGNEISKAPQRLYNDQVGYKSNGTGFDGT